MAYLATGAWVRLMNHVNMLGDWLRVRLDPKLRQVRREAPVTAGSCQPEAIMSQMIYEEFDRHAIFTLNRPEALGRRTHGTATGASTKRGAPLSRDPLDGRDRKSTRLNSSHAD